MNAHDLAVLRAKDPYLAFTRALIAFHPRPDVLNQYIHPTQRSSIQTATSRQTDCFSIGPHAVIRAALRASAAECAFMPTSTIYDNVTIGDGLSHSFRRRHSRELNSSASASSFITTRWSAATVLVTPKTKNDAGSRFRKPVAWSSKTTSRSAPARPSTAPQSAKRASSAAPKIDNLVQIGHSCTVGEDTLLCAQVGLAGSSHIGNRVILAGQAGVAGHITIGDDVVLTAKSATSHDVPAGKDDFGNSGVR